MTQKTEKKKPLIILTGPTAVGKTAASIGLAKAVNGEIISADSIHCSCKSSGGRDHFGGFDAGIPAHGYWFREDFAGRDERCETLSDRCA